MRTVEWTGWIQSSSDREALKFMLKKSLQDKTWIALDVHGCTWPKSTTYGLLSHCKGGQPRWKEPSPFSLTLPSSENSPELRTTLHDSTGNYQETEVHHQGFCFEDQGDKYRQKNTYGKDDIDVFLSLVKILFKTTYFSCLLSILPSFLHFSSRSKLNWLHIKWQGKPCFSSNV